MEKDQIQRRNKLPKEVYKDVVITNVREKHKEKRLPGGRDSPESGSLYSDYESGQQYEQDLPSGYNSGEQYDTLSTGYMSGEAYELPETRQELQEPTLASIEEVSTRSAEDLFTISIPADSQLMNQVDCLNSSSSSSTDIHARDNEPPSGLLPDGGLHKSAKRKKQVSYCVSVPMENSPLGDIRAYRELPSDTDTTSCFDSDGTYMKSDLQSSDSGAALLQVSRKKRRERSGDNEREKGMSRGNKRRLRKVKQIIRNHEEFFLIHDNKYWAIARLVCFWCSVAAILSSILFAVVMILLMPATCDPQVPWWQGSLILEISPDTHPGPELGSPGSLPGSPGSNKQLDIQAVIGDIPAMQAIGVKGVKLINLYLNQTKVNQSHLNPGDRPEIPDNDAFNHANDMTALADQLVGNKLESLGELADKLHAANISLLVDIPTYSTRTTVEPELYFMVSKAIQFWAEIGADGLDFLGLEKYAKDRFISERLSSWVTDFEKFSPRSHRILVSSTKFPQAYAADGPSSLADSSPVADIHLLETDLNISIHRNFTELHKDLEKATEWDRAPSLPWILWRHVTKLLEDLTPAQLSLQMFLPGTITLPASILRSHFNMPLQNSTTTGDNAQDAATHNETLLGQLIKARENAVPLYMNGNFKTCHGSCTETLAEMKQPNFKVTILGDKLVVMERHYNRRNRYLLLANLGEEQEDLTPVSGLFAGGEVIIDTSTALVPGDSINFKTHPGILPYHAIAVKLPK